MRKRKKNILFKLCSFVVFLLFCLNEPNRVCAAFVVFQFHFLLYVFFICLPLMFMRIEIVCVCSILNMVVNVFFFCIIKKRISSTFFCLCFRLVFLCVFSLHWLRCMTCFLLYAFLVRNLFTRFLLDWRSASRFLLHAHNSLIFIPF